MSKGQKIMLCILAIWCILWACLFGYLVFVMPDYGTGVLH
jgi:hypothetical protein